jgi:hypothetical protein
MGSEGLPGSASLKGHQCVVLDLSPWVLLSPQNCAAHSKVFADFMKKKWFKVGQHA